MTTKPAYEDLTRTYTRLHHFRHMQAMLAWDRNAMMPPAGSEARAAALAELGALMHRTRTEPRLSRLVDAAEQESLDSFERANLREIRRDLRRATAVPESLVVARTLAVSRCEHGWRRQRMENDWQGFLANFREVLKLAREHARLLAADSGLTPYDALLDRYEPGMRSAELERLFTDLRGWLPSLLTQVREKQRNETIIAPVGPFPPAQQRALNLQLMQLLGFDFEAGRLDESIHPFNGGVPEDVRMTTRYHADDFLHSLMGTIHETGHARYEQNLPRAWVDQPVGRARSFGIHESQSLAFEMQLARNPGFARVLAPLLDEHLGHQPAFEPDNLARLLTRVRPGLIRVDADELTYPAHIILRFEIERALIEGEIEAEDIPAMWDEKMQQLLGLDTRDNFRDGCLQDVHWPEGAFGYFPSYTLGAMYAAQWFAALHREHPELDADIAAGRLQPVFDWLQRNIWSRASQFKTPELTRRATGEPLNPAHFRNHLETRYLADS